MDSVILLIIPSTEPVTELKTPSIESVNPPIAASKGSVILPVISPTIPSKLLVSSPVTLSIMPVRSSVMSVNTPSNSSRTVPSDSSIIVSNEPITSSITPVSCSSMTLVNSPIVLSITESSSPKDWSRMPSMSDIIAPVMSELISSIDPDKEPITRSVIWLTTELVRPVIWSESTGGSAPSKIPCSTPVPSPSRKSCIASPIFCRNSTLGLWLIKLT